MPAPFPLGSSAELNFPTSLGGAPEAPAARRTGEAAKQHSEPAKSDPQRFDSAPILYNSHMLASTALASIAPALLPGASRQ